VLSETGISESLVADLAICDIFLFLTRFGVIVGVIVGIRVHIAHMLYKKEDQSNKEKSGSIHV